MNENMKNEYIDCQYFKESNSGNLKHDPIFMPDHTYHRGQYWNQSQKCRFHENYL